MSFISFPVMHEKLNSATLNISHADTSVGQMC